MVQSSTATQLDVTWDPPPLDAQNGDIQGYKVSIMCLFFLCVTANQPNLHHAFLIFLFLLKNSELFYSLYRSISGSFSSRTRRSACVLYSCRSSEWSLKTWQATPPTWSVWQPSTLQGMGPAPCPPEGALSKQVSCGKSRCGWGDCSDCLKKRPEAFIFQLLPAPCSISQLCVCLFIPLSFLFLSPSVDCTKILPLSI